MNVLEMLSNDPPLDCPLSILANDRPGQAGTGSGKGILKILKIP